MSEKALPDGVLSAREEPTVIADDGSSSISEQAGVRKARVVHWSRNGLILAYVGLFLTIFASRLQVYSVTVYNAFAKSAFSQHSLLSTAGVVSDITRLCAYPIIAKMDDVFGRAEGFVFSTVFLVLGAVLYASCPNIGTYVAAGVFDAIGDTGLLITEQVFIADTTSIINRGFWSATPESTTSIVAIYVGSIIADSVLARTTWRWGYGMWAIILPFCATLLIGVMFFHERRTIKEDQFEKENSGASKPRVSLLGRAGKFIWDDLDILGAVLLVAGFALILIPLSLTGSATALSDGWDNPSFIAMLVIGAVSLVAFGIWDGKFARHPFVPYRLLKDRTVVSACLLGGFDFCSYAIFGTIFPSFLQVAGGYSPGHASRVNNSLTVSYQVARIATGVLLRFTKRPQIWVLFGVPLCVLGQGLMIYFTNMPGGKLASEVSFVVAKVLVGIGRGFYHTASQVSVQAIVTKQEVAVATAVFLACMTVGGAIGQSVGGALWRNTLLGKLVAYLPEENRSNATAIYGSIVVAQEYPFNTPARDAVNRSYRESQCLLAIVATAVLAPMVLIMLFMKRIHLKPSAIPEDQNNQTNEGIKSFTNVHEEQMGAQVGFCGLRASSKGIRGISWLSTRRTPHESWLNSGAVWWNKLLSRQEVGLKILSDIKKKISSGNLMDSTDITMSNLSSRWNLPFRPPLKLRDPKTNPSQMESRESSQLLRLNRLPIASTLRHPNRIPALPATESNQASGDRESRPAIIYLREQKSAETKPQSESLYTTSSLGQELFNKCSVAHHCFRSEPWRLESAYSETPFYIHEELLKKSSPALYSVCERKWVEAQGRVYRFNKAVSEQVIACFLSYAYHGNYVFSDSGTGGITLPSIEKESNNLQVAESEDTTSVSNSEEIKFNPGGVNAEGIAHPLLLHVQVYVFADTYLIAELQSLAREKIQNSLREMKTLDSERSREMVLDLLDYAFDNLREEDILLIFLSLYASNKLDTLRLSSHRLEALLLGSDGKFVRHLLPKISGSREDPLEFSDAALSKFALGE